MATASTTPPPHLVFLKLLNLLDDMRRECVHNVSAGQLKKMLGLTMRQGSAISQLKLMLADQPAGVPLKALATRMQMSVPATSLLVEGMVRKGFFERHPNPDDRRSVLIVLSERGMSMFHEVYGYFRDMLDAAAADITPQEMEALDSVVHKLELRQAAK